MELVELPYPEGRLPLLQARVLTGVRHGFPTRAGGVSAAPYDSLNLAVRWGDASENVAENRRRLFAACGAARVAMVNQVHGRDVAVVRGELLPDTKADALVTNEPGVGVGVFTADCVPILIADPATGAVAAVHAGWRGVIAGVLPAALAALAREYGSRAANLRVALGPAIGPCCFEVGDEVAAAFAAAFPGVPLAQVGPAGKPHVDLKRALGVQLAAAGVREVEAGPECTKCDPARFYSYRRDNTRTGQHLAVIVAGG